ncbi:MAG: YdcH family protein [Xanthomonadales bacterium]|nr:YdcH family protein [Xanthomonadales bacterium]
MFESHPRDEVEALLQNDNEFRQLFRRHQELDKQVLDAELGVLPIDDATLARMKKEKLHAKDRLVRMFETRGSVH